MTKATTILVAVGAITGGTRRAKDAPFAAATLGDGEELTEQAATALGLDEAAIADLKTRGALIELSARVAEAGDAPGADQSGARAVTVARAEAAEARVTALEAELDAAKKAAAKA